MILKISVIITVYNKAQFLPGVIKSLINQTIAPQMEFIFVDDASTDNSIEIIKQNTSKIQNIQIIKSEQNLGPSIRLNQGAKKASGEYLLLMDGDDVLFNNAAEIMLNLIENKRADFIYGKRKKLETTQNISIVEKIEFVLSNEPLYYILTNKNLVNMSSLVRYDLFKKAEGCDERIFIQDESLPLRLALNAKRFIDLKNAVIGIMPEGNKHSYKRLSKNLSQQFHDRFLAYYNFINDNYDKIDRYQNLLFNRCVSTMWKHAQEQQAFPYLSKYFWYYILSKIYPRLQNKETIEKINHEFSKVANIRRMKESGAGCRI